MFRVFIAFIMFVSVLSPVAAADWRLDPAASSIVFKGAHAGSDFEGQFTDWAADISFDPANLASASVSVTVKTASAVTGNSLYDATLHEKDWFYTESFPKAVFSAKNFSATGEGRYQAMGTLTIRETTKPVVLDFSLTIQDGRAVMKASHTLNRLAYGLGAGSDASGDWVSTDIKLLITVSAAAE